MRIAYIAALAAAVVASPSFAKGFHADAHVGYDRVSIEGERSSGVVYGGAVGYDLPVSGNVFLGIEAGIDGSSVKECFTDGIDTACLKAGRDLSVVGRLGTALGGNGKLYALAGYTNQRLKATLTGPSFGNLSDGVNEDGYRLGAGYQFAFTKRVYGKLEYRYSHYHDSDLDVSLNRHSVIAGVGFGF